MEMIAAGLKDALDGVTPKSSGDAAVAFADDAERAAFVKALSSEKVHSPLAPLPSLIQEVEYHFSNFQQRFLQSNTLALIVHSSRASLDSSFVLTPIKSLLVFDLIAQSLNI